MTFFRYYKKNTCEERVMKITIPKETTPGENRVSAVPETVKKMLAANFSVHVQMGAGSKSFIPDELYQKAGATIEANAENSFRDADLVTKVIRPDTQEVSYLKKGAILVAPIFPFANIELVKSLNANNITVFSLDLIPRIARAQSMDILSSMSSIAGYKSIVMAADRAPKLFPMMTTAAGTILPAKVMIIGAGVAGLQAIATAKRLGCVVLAFDTRPIVEEQVKSLGADFVSMETTHEAQDAGGYAKEQSAEFYKKEQDIIHKYIKDADVIVTTALIPGKKPPLLITAEMIREMKEGAVIVDLAAEQGGNCELLEPGKEVVKHNVTLIGLYNLPSMLPVHASFLFSKNVWSFLNYLSPQLADRKFDLNDEIIKGCLIAHNGEIIHPLLKGR